jgi:hypothetical protein
VPSKRDLKIFYENQSIRGFFDFQSSFQNCFWNLFSTSDLSQIVKIRKLSRNTQITSSEKSSWRLKLSFCLKILIFIEKADFSKLCSNRFLHYVTSSLMTPIVPNVIKKNLILISKLKMNQKISQVGSWYRLL